MNREMIGRRYRPSSVELREADLIWSLLVNKPRSSSRLSRGRFGLPGLYEEDLYDETSPAPAALPSGNPVPFAPNPPAGSVWPIRTQHPRAHEINYRAEDGSSVGGNAARRFLADRGEGARYHVGIDLYANLNDPVVAIADGRIVAFYPFCCGDNKTTWALLVEHENVVINYGEVSPTSLSDNNLSIGNRVSRGQVIGKVGRNPGGSSMIHFETYVPGTTRNHSWRKANPRPSALLNPTRLLLWLRDHGAASGAGANSGANANTSASSGGTVSTAGSIASAVSRVAASAVSGVGALAGAAVAAMTSQPNWTAMSREERMRYAVNRLVTTYGYPVNGAAGIVGNLWAESGILPNRVEGSQQATPMRARDFNGVVTDFTAAQIMNRDRQAQQGPRLPGIGLAQWTSSARRRGLFQHQYQGRVLGENVLFSMDAQLDYLVNELNTNYTRVNRVVRDASVTVDDASDEVLYNFEVPGSILTTTEPRRKLPRTDPAVQAVFEARRRHARSALQASQRSGATATHEAILPEDLDEAAFKQAVLDEQVRRALAGGRVRYAGVPADQLEEVEGGHRLRTAAAGQCRALLDAARSALVEARTLGTDAGAAQVTHIGIVSSYRGPQTDSALWHRYYPRYYRETETHRAGLEGGPHGQAAVRYLARYISGRKAAPGFSNHSDGRAVDFTTTQGGVVYGANSSQRAGWRLTWLHRWLVTNANRFGFRPLATEEWHWDYTG